MNLVKVIRSAADGGNIILGSKNTLRAVLNGDAKFVVVASNCELGALEDLNKYSKLASTEVHRFDGSTVELGEVCGKPFVVSMLAILESKKSKAKVKRKK